MKTEKEILNTESMLHLEKVLVRNGNINPFMMLYILSTDSQIKNIDHEEYRKWLIDQYDSMFNEYELYFMKKDTTDFKFFFCDRSVMKTVNEDSIFINYMANKQF